MTMYEESYQLNKDRRKKRISMLRAQIRQGKNYAQLVSFCMSMFGNPSTNTINSYINEAAAPWREKAAKQSAATTTEVKQTGLDAFG